MTFFLSGFSCVALVFNIDRKIDDGVPTTGKVSICLYLARLIGITDDVEDSPTTTDIEQGTGETVLVIDDEPTIGMLIAEVLQEHGYIAIEAETALLACASSSPTRGSTC
jgi:hypothetical protein